MTDTPFDRHPAVAAVFAIGLGVLLVSMVGYRVVVPFYRPLSTVVFLLGIFGFGIAIVSGTWYVSLFLRDLL